MREFLFCGITNDGERLEGFYMQSGLSGIPFIGASNSYGTMLWRAVKPETVGQFTGRIDKNGKKVFEYDILQILGGIARGIVQWCENDQCYVLATKEGWHIDDFGNYGRPEYYEVIGNIHDNPELLSDSG